MSAAFSLIMYMSHLRKGSKAPLLLLSLCVSFTCHSPPPLSRFFCPVCHSPSLFFLVFDSLSPSLSLCNRVFWSARILV